MNVRVLNHAAPSQPDTDAARLAHLPEEHANQRPVGLEALDEQPLTAPALERWRTALEASRGEPPWRTRKAAELRDLLALEQCSERFAVLAIDARTELIVTARLRVTVPVMEFEARAEGEAGDPTPPRPLMGEATPTAEALPPWSPAALLARMHGGALLRSVHKPGAVRIANEATLELRYVPELLRGPLPGYSAVAVLAPQQVWHSNVSFDRQQKLCIGRTVPRGMPMRELVLLAHAALTMQAVTLEHGDPAGVMNTAALWYWRERRDQLPLSAATLLTPLEAPSEPTGGAA
ncbi:MAG: hypothetical protein R3F49_06080 [Planctomycetota bacterium]